MSVIKAKIQNYIDCRTWKNPSADKNKENEQPEYLSYFLGIPLGVSKSKKLEAANQLLGIEKKEDLDKLSNNRALKQGRLGDLFNELAEEIEKNKATTSISPQPSSFSTHPNQTIATETEKIYNLPDDNTRHIIGLLDPISQCRFAKTSKNMNLLVKLERKWTKYLKINKNWNIKGALGAYKDAKNLKTLDLSECYVTDEDLRFIANHFKNLTSLNLSYTKITDVGLGYIAGFTQLTSLGLSWTKITDAGLEHIAGFTQLTSLDLSWTKITGAGLVHIVGLRHLTSLDLSDTKIAEILM